MENFKIGDKVEYEGQEFLVVDFDQINEQVVVEDAEGERFGVEEGELLEAYCSKGKSVNKEGYMLKAQKKDDESVEEGAAGSVGISNLEKPQHKGTAAGRSSITGKPIVPTKKEPPGGPAAFLKKNEEVELEETKAADSIKMDSGYNTSVMASNMIKAMGSLPKSDQVAFFDKMMSDCKAMCANAGGVKDGEAAKNKASVEMKPTVSHSLPQMTKEDLDLMLEGHDLTEEFKAEASVLFEAAVNLRVTELREEIEAEYETQLEENMAELTATLEEQIDSYLSYVAEEWVAENEVAIESSLKNELSESFIEGLHNLFAEHYIDVPAAKVDVVAEMAARVDELEGQLNEQINENIELCEAVQEFAGEEIFSEMCDGLAVSQQEKFRTLTEGVSFDGNEEEYRAKLGIIREKYFKVTAPANTLNEEVELVGEASIDHESAAVMTPEMAHYAQAISRTQKR